MYEGMTAVKSELYLLQFHLLGVMLVFLTYKASDHLARKLHEKQERGLRLLPEELVINYKDYVLTTGRLGR